MTLEIAQLAGWHGDVFRRERVAQRRRELGAAWASVGCLAERRHDASLEARPYGLRCHDASIATSSASSSYARPSAPAAFARAPGAARTDPSSRGRERNTSCAPSRDALVCDAMSQASPAAPASS